MTIENDPGIDDGIIVSSFDFKMEGDDDLWELVKAE